MNPQDNDEKIKRIRERRFAIALGVLFAGLTLGQALWGGRDQDYGFLQSLIYFAILHFNVLLIMFLVFLVSRNLIKAYLERRQGRIGSSLRWKMISSLLAFSLLPSILLFVGASTIIRQGFDRWFSTQVQTTLRDAESVAGVHYASVEENLRFFAQNSLQAWAKQRRKPGSSELSAMLKSYPLHGAELYDSLTSSPERLRSQDTPDWALPRAAAQSLRRAFDGESFALIRSIGEDDILQLFVPWDQAFARASSTLPGEPLVTRYVLVLTHRIPFGLQTRISDLKASFAGYTKTLSFKDQLKTNYTLVLLTLFILVIFVVSWFGLYIAKSVTDPVSQLLRATEAFRSGDWNYRIAVTNPGRTGGDLDLLKDSFNAMASEVGARGQQLEAANSRLQELVGDLEERERYLEKLLSSIRRGVVVLDTKQRISRINTEAAALAMVDSTAIQVLLGRRWDDLFRNLGQQGDVRQWLDESTAHRGRPVDRIFEWRRGEGRNSELRSIRCTGISLDDESGRNGWMVILEDVSDASRLERLAAWQEVARRVAHEIKNPLTPIQISADRLQRRLLPQLAESASQSELLSECLSQIQKQVRVIRDLVKEFSDAAKLPEPQFQEIQLVSFVTQILADYRFLHPEIRFHFDFSSELEMVRVQADPEYLRRLVVNLADNSVHSLMQAKTLDPSFSVQVLSAPQNGWVRLRFVDNGPGVPPTMADKIFDPYVTSKASGLGLGLAIVRRIAMEHGGQITCIPGPGATFVLDLPMVWKEDLKNVQIVADR